MRALQSQLHAHASDAVLLFGIAMVVFAGVVLVLVETMERQRTVSHIEAVEKIHAVGGSWTQAEP